MKSYKVKFFGSKQEKGKLEQVKTNVIAIDAASVEGALRRSGYKVIKGLKIGQGQDIDASAQA